MYSQHTEGKTTTGLQASGKLFSINRQLITLLMVKCTRKTKRFDDRDERNGILYGME